MAGNDYFEYRVFDGHQYSDIARVTIYVNLIPVAGIPEYYVAEWNVPLVVQSGQGVLTNDVDPDSQPLEAILAQQATHGTVVLNADGSFTYTPIAGFLGKDTFSYLVSDGSTQSDPVTVTIQLFATSEVPEIKISDVTIADSEAGGATADFLVYLTAPSTETITVNYQLQDDTAVVVEDFLPLSGTLTFLPGEMYQTVTVHILEDGLEEGLEYFTVQLSDNYNAVLGDAEGLGRIIDESYYLTPNDNPQLISLNLVSDTGIIGDSITTYPVISAGLIDRASSSGIFFVELDFDNDGAANATAWAGTDGTIFYDLSGDVPFGEVTIRARATEWDANSGTFLTGNWLQLSFEYQNANGPGPTFTSVDLLTDDPTNNTTSRPIIVGTLQREDAGSLVNLRVEYDLDGDGIADGAVYSNADGSGEFLIDLSNQAFTTGEVSIHVRAGQTNDTGWGYQFGDWTQFAFDYIAAEPLVPELPIVDVPEPETFEYANFQNPEQSPAVTVGSAAQPVDFAGFDATVTVGPFFGTRYEVPSSSVSDSGSDFDLVEDTYSDVLGNYDRERSWQETWIVSATVNLDGSWTRHYEYHYEYVEITTFNGFDGSDFTLNQSGWQTYIFDAVGDSNGMTFTLDDSGSSSFEHWRTELITTAGAGTEILVDSLNYHNFGTQNYVLNISGEQTIVSPGVITSSETREYDQDGSETIDSVRTFSHYASLGGAMLSTHSNDAVQTKGWEYVSLTTVDTASDGSWTITDDFDYDDSIQTDYTELKWKDETFSIQSSGATTSTQKLSSETLIGTTTVISSLAGSKTSDSTGDWNALSDFVNTKAVDDLLTKEDAEIIETSYSQGGVTAEFKSEQSAKYSRDRDFTQDISGTTVSSLLGPTTYSGTESADEHSSSIIDTAFVSSTSGTDNSVPGLTSSFSTSNSNTNHEISTNIYTSGTTTDIDSNGQTWFLGSESTSEIRNGSSSWTISESSSVEEDRDLSLGHHVIVSAATSSSDTGQSTYGSTLKITGLYGEGNTSVYTGTATQDANTTGQRSFSDSYERSDETQDTSTPDLTTWQLRTNSQSFDENSKYDSQLIGNSTLIAGITTSTMDATQNESGTRSSSSSVTSHSTLDDQRGDVSTNVETKQDSSTKSDSTFSSKFDGHETTSNGVRTYHNVYSELEDGDSTDSSNFSNNFTSIHTTKNGAAEIVYTSTITSVSGSSRDGQGTFSSKTDATEDLLANGKITYSLTTSDEADGTFTSNSTSTRSSIAHDESVEGVISDSKSNEDSSSTGQGTYSSSFTSTQQKLEDGSITSQALSQSQSDETGTGTTAATSSSNSGGTITVSPNVTNNFAASTETSDDSNWSYSSSITTTDTLFTDGTRESISSTSSTSENDSDWSSSYDNEATLTNNANPEIAISAHENTTLDQSGSSNSTSSSQASNTRHRDGTRSLTESSSFEETGDFETHSTSKSDSTLTNSSDTHPYTPNPVTFTGSRVTKNTYESQDDSTGTYTSSDVMSYAYNTASGSTSYSKSESSSQSDGTSNWKSTQSYEQHTSRIEDWDQPGISTDLYTKENIDTLQTSETKGSGTFEEYSDSEFETQNQTSTSWEQFTRVENGSTEFSDSITSNYEYKNFSDPHRQLTSTTFLIGSNSGTGSYDSTTFIDANLYANGQRDLTHTEDYSTDDTSSGNSTTTNTFSETTEYTKDVSDPESPGTTVTLAESSDASQESTVTLSYTGTSKSSFSSEYRELKDGRVEGESSQGSTDTYHSKTQTDSKSDQSFTDNSQQTFISGELFGPERTTVSHSESTENTDSDRKIVASENRSFTDGSSHFDSKVTETELSSSDWMKNSWTTYTEESKAISSYHWNKYSTSKSEQEDIGESTFDFSLETVEDDGALTTTELVTLDSTGYLTNTTTSEQHDSEEAYTDEHDPTRTKTTLVDATSSRTESGDYESFYQLSAYGYADKTQLRIEQSNYERTGNIGWNDTQGSDTYSTQEINGVTEVSFGSADASSSGSGTFTEKSETLNSDYADGTYSYWESAQYTENGSGTSDSHQATYYRDTKVDIDQDETVTILDETQDSARAFTYTTDNLVTKLVEDNVTTHGGHTDSTSKGETTYSNTSHYSSTETQPATKYYYYTISAIEVNEVTSTEEGKIVFDNKHHTETDAAGEVTTTETRDTTITATSNSLDTHKIGTLKIQTYVDSTLDQYLETEITTADVDKKTANVSRHEIYQRHADGNESTTLVSDYSKLDAWNGTMPTTEKLTINVTNQTNYYYEHYELTTDTDATYTRLYQDPSNSSATIHETINETTYERDLITYEESIFQGSWRNVDFEVNTNSVQTKTTRTWVSDSFLDKLLGGPVAFLYADLDKITYSDLSTYHQDTKCLSQNSCCTEGNPGGDKH